MSGMPRTPTLTADQLLDTPAGSGVNVAIEIDASEDGILNGRLIEPDEKDPFSRYHRTTTQIRVHWNDETKVVMGERDDVAVGAPIWVTGVFRDDDAIDASLFALLRGFADVED